MLPSTASALLCLAIRHVGASDSTLEPKCGLNLLQYAVESDETVTSNCKGWCSTNTFDWTAKCGWGTCGGCDICDSIALPTVRPTPSPTQSIAGCRSWCADDSSPWKAKCSWANCHACDHCPQPTPSPTQLPTSPPTGAPTASPSEPPTPPPTGVPTPSPTTPPPTTPLQNPDLVAYWDADACGPHGDDYHWDWCGERAFQCKDFVGTTLCDTGMAKLVATLGDGTSRSTTIAGCDYQYYAQYKCLEEQDSNADLVAYWDSGTCGPHGDDYHWDWCGQAAFTCQAEVTTAACPSGKAKLVATLGDGTDRSTTIAGCDYQYYAQYACDTTTPSPTAPPAPTPSPTCNTAFDNTKCNSWLLDACCGIEVTVGCTDGYEVVRTGSCGLVGLKTQYTCRPPC